MCSNLILTQRYHNGLFFIQFFRCAISLYNEPKKKKPNISITSFQNIHLETIGEVAPYLFAISKVGKVQFHSNKDADGKFDINTPSISFDSPVFKHFLKEWADSKVIINHLRDEAQFSPDETTKAFLLNRADEIEQELELRMVDSQMLIQSAKKIRSLIGSLLVYSLHFPQTVSILQAQSPETFDL